MMWNKYWKNLSHEPKQQQCHNQPDFSVCSICHITLAKNYDGVVITSGRVKICILMTLHDSAQVLLPLVIDDQQDATILVYLFIPTQLYMFRAMFSPIIRSTWLYLQLLILPTNVAAGWYHGLGGTAVPPHPWYQPAATSVDNIRSCKYSQVFLMMGENIARNM